MASRLTKNIDEIIIENSLEIYNNELSLTKKGYNYIGLCPIHGENTPSFNINSDYPYICKCFGCGFSSNVIGFIKELYNFSYEEAIDYINNKKPNLKSKEFKLVTKEELIIDFVDMPFTKEGHKYWNDYHLTEDFLKNNNVFQVKTYAINKRIVKHEDDRLIFAYHAKDIDKVKLLFIGESVKKEEKWRNNCPGEYLWFYNEIKNNTCDKLFLSKSVKDSLVLKLLDRCTIATQSENAQVVLDNNVEKINKISNNVIVVFGSDKQGKEQSHILTKATGWKHFNTPDKLLRKYNINDPAELVKAYSLKELEKELKNKNL